MNVAAIVHGYPAGAASLHAGAEYAAHALFRHLVAQGHAVDVLVTDAVQREPAMLDGVRIVPSSWAKRMYGSRDYDITVTHLTAAPKALHHASVAGRSTAVLAHNSLPVYVGIVARGRVAAGAARVVVHNSRHVYEEHVGDVRYGRTMSRFTHAVLHPPVPVAEYRTLRGDHVTLVNLTENKGARLFWSLAETMPDVPFMAVVGSYGRQVIPDVIPGNVTLVGPTASMRDDVYRRTRVLLVPSVTETWGRVAVEAGASGIPVVASPTPGLLEALGGSGVFVDERDRTAWEAAIMSLLSDDAAYGAVSAAVAARAVELDAISVRQLEMVEDALVAAVRRERVSGTV